MKSDFPSFAARLRALIAHDQIGARDINFADLALELFALQFTTNPAYRKICKARYATPLTVSNWTQIPAVPTAAFKELELSCLPPAQRTHVFHSSGTTQQKPSRHFHHTESLAVYDTSLWNWFAVNALDQPPAIGDWQLAILTPPPSHAPHSSLVHMFDIIRQELDAGETVFGGGISSDGAWTLNLECIVAQLAKTSQAGQPILILGTAFSFVQLLDHFGETGRQFRLPPGSRIMETGGYKGRSREIPKPELHALITRRLGIPASDIVCEYGMSELSSQAYDSASGAARSFHFPPWARVQIISSETGCEVADGETGLIRVFDLANVFSVLAVQTEDLGVRRDDGFELLGRAVAAEPRGCSLMAV